MRREDAVHDAVVGVMADAGVDPVTAMTPEQYVTMLGRVRRQSGLSYRAVARRADSGGQALPASTLATMLHRATLPRPELVAALLDACGVPVDRQAIWLSQWRRLAGDQAAPQPNSDPGPEPVPIPRQLPAAPGQFAGRIHELAHLSGALDTHGAAAISTITGTGGVGKTWLALRWAHHKLDRYPDGQLYLNLRGFDPSGRPTPPEEALNALLAALGVAPAAIPAGPDAQVGLYRSLIAGRKMLILLDNARDADQVRPLLPGSAGCAVIITSRQQLTSLVATEGADLLMLDLLNPVDAYQLLTLRLGEHRLTDEPAATAEIISRCARLPLALALVAARAARQPQWTLAALASELRDGEYRLDALSSEAPAVDIRAVLSWSYRALTPDAARLLRLLGSHPGPDIGVRAAASLAGVPIRRVRQLLAELADANLAAEHRLGRYSLHDLLRAYASEQANAADFEDERRDAVGRVLDHYLHTAYAAGLLLTPHREPITIDPPGSGVAPEQLADLSQALDWYAREYRVLVAAIKTANAGFESHVWRLADALGGFFTRQGHWHDWHATSRAALRAAQRTNNLPAQARAHCWLAELYAWIGRFDDTSVHLDQAGLLYYQLGHTTGPAYVHLCRGWVYEPQQRYHDALHHAEQALHLYTVAGHPHGQANALNNIGWYHARLGNYEQAIEYCRKALHRHQQLDSRSWQGRSWDSLGYAYHQLGQYETAIACYGHAVDLFHDLGSRYYGAKALGRLGDAHLAAAQPQSARHAWQRAHDILHQLQHPDAHHIRAKLTGHTANRALT